MNTIILSGKKLLIALLLVCFIPLGISNAETASEVFDYRAITAEYMNAHFVGMAEDFSKEQGIQEEVRALMLSAGLIREEDYEEGVLPLTELEQFCNQNGIPWEKQITVPIIHDLFDCTGGVSEQQGNAVTINVNGWFRVAWADGSFYMGEMDENKHFTNGIYFYADAGALYWGAFVNNKREGSGVILYTNNDCYAGAWKEDQMQGYGTYYFGGQPAGEYYSGYWEHSMMNGEGIYFKGEEQLKAIWQDNVPVEKMY